MQPLFDTIYYTQPFVFRLFLSIYILDYPNFSSHIRSLFLSASFIFNFFIFTMPESSYSLHNTDPIEFDDADYGIPSVCFCGGRVLLESSMRNPNPGRLFYTCQERFDGGCHISKWWDEAMMEELRRLRQEIHAYPSMNEMRETLTVHRDAIAHLHDLRTQNENELVWLKAMIDKKRDVIAKELKNAVVAFFVVLAIIIYLFK